MRRPCIFALVSFLALIPIQAANPTVRVVDFDTNVNLVTAKRITTAIDDAEDAGDELVLVKLDTPGGMVTSMEGIVKRMLAAHRIIEDGVYGLGQALMVITALFAHCYPLDVRYSQGDECITPWVPDYAMFIFDNFIVLY